MSFCDNPIGCDSERILELQAKHSDAFAVRVPHLDLEKVGYAPYIYDANGGKMTGGDYTRLKICLECGRVQGFPKLSDEEVHDAIHGD